MGSACAILFTADICARVGELVTGAEDRAFALAGT